MEKQIDYIKLKKEVTASIVNSLRDIQEKMNRETGCTFLCMEVELKQMQLARKYSCDIERVNLAILLPDNKTALTEAKFTEI